MGYLIDECDRKCPLCGGKMEEIYGDHGGQYYYYYDKCQRCGVQIGFFTEKYYVDGIIDGIDKLICAQNMRRGRIKKNKWNKDYGRLIPYLELFK